MGLDWRLAITAACVIWLSPAWMDSLAPRAFAQETAEAEHEHDAASEEEDATATEKKAVAETKAVAEKKTKAAAEATQAAVVKKAAGGEEAAKADVAKAEAAAKKAAEEAKKAAAAAPEVEMTAEQKAAVARGMAAVLEKLGGAQPDQATAIAETTSGESPAEGAATPAPTPVEPEPPAPPMFRMRDGTRIAGEAGVDTIRVTTAYGELRVPVDEIVRLRFSVPPDPVRAERIRVLVEQLGSDEYDLREEAMEGLRAVGSPAIEALRAAVESEDAEVRTRAEKLVTELEEELDDEDEDLEAFLVALRGEEDEIVTVKFTAMGRIELSGFNVETPYGQMELRRDDILSVVFRKPPYLRRSFDVSGSRAFAANKKWIDTGLALAQGTGLKISATGTLQLTQYGTSCGPEGTTNVSGNQLDSFPVGSLVGRVGDKGAAFLIGSEYEATANASGNLMLGISLKSGSVKGKFDVQVEIALDEEEEGDDDE